MALITGSITSGGSSSWEAWAANSNIFVTSWFVNKIINEFLRNVSINFNSFGDHSSGDNYKSIDTLIQIRLISSNGPQNIFVKRWCRINNHKKSVTNLFDGVEGNASNRDNSWKQRVGEFQSIAKSHPEPWVSLQSVRAYLGHACTTFRQNLQKKFQLIHIFKNVAILNLSFIFISSYFKGIAFNNFNISSMKLLPFNWLIFHLSEQTL